MEQGKLDSELGKTYFLANLAIFGITGGMLQRSGASGAAVWIAVLGHVFKQVDEGWGRWAEGFVDADEEEDVPIENDSEDEDEPMPLASTSTSAPPPSKPRRRIRQSVPANLTPKLLLLTSTAHLSTLANLLTSPSSNASTTLLVHFATFTLGLLNAFRGSSRWEGILDALMEGQKGRALGRRMWREGVRGKWSGNGAQDGWETFSESAYTTLKSVFEEADNHGADPSTPCLLFLTHLYNHYLLLTPDDEFFSETHSNPLSLDEVLEMAAIWRDLAFWGYMAGVAPPGQTPLKGRGTEDARSLFTRGVTRVAERK